MGPLGPEVIVIHLAKNIMESVPRPPECLKYILRVHLRVGFRSMDRTLRQLTVRPFVLLELLYYLVERRRAMWRTDKDVPSIKKELAAAIQK